MQKAEWTKYRLDFLFEARTSRETMRHKDTYFVRLEDEATGKTGIGECALFRGLSADDLPDYETRLDDACRVGRPNPDYSSQVFGFETARRNLHPLEDNAFTRGETGVPINGLIWMGDKSTMRQRIDEKLAKGFNVLKLKIGGINFDEETELLRYIRSRYSASDLTIRLDANGSFSPADALKRLKILSDFGIHSIEQPIKAGQESDMARICSLSPIPIALDEELICRVPDPDLLSRIKPQYIILKPALCGGFSGADMWIKEAERLGIGWWATSALESNIGLEAIARWLMREHSEHALSLPQGLGTGQLYGNNIPSPLELRGDKLYFNPEKSWNYSQLSWHR